MNISGRIKFLRKSRELTQAAFAEKIKISRSNIANIEVGRINISDRTISDICREFNVNEEWLRYGFGEISTKVDSLKQCLKDNNATNDDIKLIKCYLNLDLEIRNKIHEHFKKYFNNI
ncbi:helix-turn-helix transcriptional regulator [uncultured Clostridium sp.]|uniref:helix-turn-helix domain-containing protein n=1 Tax=uncultured Clostridium sp. TaxID=59620 RepID=UPI00260FE23F|nr:helix-turn-helix transcriptional regulator [uncultured Clostridium sp.]MCI9110277.1 helix-turn-helix transcriptional regulator [Bacilli bacterium]